MPNKSISRLNDVSKPRLWAGAIIAALVAAFLIFDGITKVIQIDAVVRASEQLGLPVNVAPVIGVVLLICTAIYVIPTTRIVGAILLTGYMGGAMAIQVRARERSFSHYFLVCVRRACMGSRCPSRTAPIPVDPAA